MEFRETLYKNELNANRQMVTVCAFAAAVLGLVWLGYIFQLFPLTDYTLVHIFMPIDILILLSPLLLKRTKVFCWPGFKYCLIFGFLFVVAILNIVVPKHAILGYALVLILACHYYSPKMGVVVFFVTLPVMLVCIYGGMFFGEYDVNLLSHGVIRYDEAGQPYIYEPLTAAERYEYLQDLLVNHGTNRYLAVFLYYYLSRALILVLIMFTCVALDARTHKLLTSEAQTRSQKETIETELRIASEIQANSLPRPFVATDDVEIFAELLPAKEVGGDFYDYIMLDSTHVAIVIGDVSGKATPGAMWMMKTVTCLEDLIRPGKKPSEILHEVNAALSKHNESATFVTCFLGVLDTQTGMLTYCNAGHNPPIIKRGGRAFYLPVSSGMVLGAGELYRGQDENFRLLKKDTLFLYTDGLTEARDANQAFFGEKRLLNFVNQTPFSSLVEFHYKLDDELDTFTKGAPQADDMTYLFLQYQGDKVSTSEIECEAILANAPKVMDFAKKALKKNAIGEKTSREIQIIIDEIFSNVAKYAYEGKAGFFYLRFQYNIDKKEIILTFVDKGVDFNMIEAHNESVTEENFEHKKEGGLGMMMVRNSVDDSSYARHGGKNILTLTKQAD